MVQIGDELTKVGMTKSEGVFLEEDYEFFQRELAGFIPDRLFDAHMHLWANTRLEMLENVAPPVGIDKYVGLADSMFEGHRVAGLIVPSPGCGNFGCVAEENQWVVEQTKIAQGIDDSYRAVLLAKPDDDPEWLRQEVRRHKMCGLKCYHLFADLEETWNAQIPDYLPESIMKVANEEGWAIVLHMVRSRAVADQENIHWLRRYCKEYPDARIILAHSARGFQPGHNLEGLAQLSEFDNLYFDCSANCEAFAHQVVLRYFGHKKLLHGSDFPVSHFRGRSVAVGDSFIWLDQNSPVWNEKHKVVKPVLVGLEHLRSLKWACWAERLSDSQVEDVFWNNAVGLFGG